MIQNPADIEEFPDQEYSTTFERLVTPRLTNNYCIQQVSNGGFYIYYTHFEITGGLCNLFGSNWCDLFTNRTIFCFKSQLFPGQ